jgi:hypothetical protein
MLDSGRISTLFVQMTRASKRVTSMAGITEVASAVSFRCMIRQFAEGTLLGDHLQKLATSFLATE